MTTPCDTCKHHKFEMVDQFTYRVWCSKGAHKDGVFESPWGCYKYKKRKGDKSSRNTGQKKN